MSNCASYAAAHLEDYADELNNGKLSAFAPIFCALAADDTGCKLKAAQILSDALQKMSCDKIGAADRQMRETTSMEWSIDWKKIKLRQLFTWRMNTEQRRAVTVFASFNPNGYMRQEAVEYLPKYPNTLPFLMLRLNDWVPNVRKAAEDALGERLKKASKEEFVEALSYAEQLKNRKINRERETPDIVTAKLLGDEGLKKMALKSKNMKARRYCILALSRADADGDSQLLIEHVPREKDPFLRRLIFDKLLPISPDKTKVCVTFIGDKSPASRARALQRLYECNPTLAEQYSERMIFDRNQTVRETARYILSQRETPVDFRRLYIENLSDETAPSIKGLGEVGSKEDCKILEGYMASESDKNVCAAMTALMQLDGESYTPKITEALASKRVSVAKRAAVLLKRSNDYD